MRLAVRPPGRPRGFRGHARRKPNRVSGLCYGTWDRRREGNGTASPFRLAGPAVPGLISQTDERGQGRSKLQKAATARVDKAARGRVASQWRARVWSVWRLSVVSLVGSPAPSPARVPISGQSEHPRDGCTRRLQPARGRNQPGSLAGLVPRKASAVCPHKRLPARCRTPVPWPMSSGLALLAVTTP